ncbi:peptide chain release factor N(5)-glutamine methyltransferase [Clostridium sp. SYSU_GA19001]|uniref:peptide chain release factor N(5)-glutamine methyltransferase n=1 Tax=Clostridium caldaquaticum TaxID=2940653 RepID=UPI0020777594|nr:peptide chain release factor N(5)-glutamine methyltransferase [Clostridium caldaquaticum]MCM8709731.1 peptide chain release factor N(5)-glutamine methyltransferase [Clostridium caldaquaticum]
MKVQELLSKGYEILKINNIESYMLDCQLILGHVLNLDRMSIIINKDMEIHEDKVKEYFGLIEKRKNKMPLKYILKKCEFMGIDFFVKEGVLIPRPDTEILVEEALKEIRSKKFSRICDVCCGSGAIGLSIAKILNYVNVDCVDISDEALSVTLQNIKFLSLEDRVRFIKSDLLAYALEENLSYDIIVSNPPYIKTEVIPTLMEDVKDYEPYIALWGGEDGLDFYRKITEQSIKVLKAGGVLAYEIGYDQGEEVKAILLEYGYTDIRVVKDLAGLDRTVLGYKK